MQKEFGVELCSEPIQFQGRVLPLSKLLNGDNHAGFYKMESPTSNWAVVCFDHRVDYRSFTSFVQTEKNNIVIHLFHFFAIIFHTNLLKKNKIKTNTNVYYNICNITCYVIYEIYTQYLYVNKSFYSKGNLWFIYIYIVQY